MRFALGTCSIVVCSVLAGSPLCALAQQEPAPEAPAATTGAGSESTPPPSAATPGDSKALAVDHYERGRAHYLAGRYREALPELKAALALDPDSPNLAYNVARVNEDLGNLDEAMAYYQRYLELLPEKDKAERAKIETALRRLEGAKEELAEQRSEAALMGFGPRPTEEPATFGRTDVWFWTATIGGASLLMAGGVTGLLALQREDDVSRFVLGPDGTFDDRDALAHDADNFALASDLCFIGGGAAVATAALLFFLRAPDGDGDEASEQAPSARLLVDVHGGGVAAQLRGRF